MIIVYSPLLNQYVGLVPVYVRLMCGQVLTLKENEYMLAEKTIGANSLRIMIRHLIPNALLTLIVVMTMMLAKGQDTLRA